MQIKGMAPIRYPPRLTADPSRRDINKKCEFHDDHGHFTEECIHLRQEPDSLARIGYLDEFLTRQPHPLQIVPAAPTLPQPANVEQPRRQRRKNKGKYKANAEQNKEASPEIPVVKGHIMMITGGTGVEGTNGMKRKRYAEECLQVTNWPEVKHNESN